MSDFKEPIIEKNIRQFVSLRTAEPVYLELRPELVIIKHLSKYGSSILATFWIKVLQHPNNYPAMRYPYRQLYDTKGNWKVVLQVDDIVITVFTKTGTLGMRGVFVLQWFKDRFQGIMDAYEAPIDRPQVLSHPYRSLERYEDKLEAKRLERKALNHYKNLEAISGCNDDERQSSRYFRPIETAPRTVQDDETPLIKQETISQAADQLPAVIPIQEEGFADEISTIAQVNQQDPSSPAEDLYENNPALAPIEVTEFTDEDVREPEVQDAADVISSGLETGETDGETEEPSATENTETVANTELIDSSELPTYLPEDIVEPAENIVTTYPRLVTESLCLNSQIRDVEFRETLESPIRTQLKKLNDHLKLQGLDLWLGDTLEEQLELLHSGCVKDTSYIYMLWKSLLHRFMSHEDTAVYIATPYLDKLRLQDICRAHLRNRLSASVDAVFVRHQCDPILQISDVKRRAIREFETRDQVYLEYKLYSSFVYPLKQFHYKFLAGVKDGIAELMVTSADFHANHFENDVLDSVTYLKMSEEEFRIRYLGPLLK